jgi:hypothetical protein
MIGKWWVTVGCLLAMLFATRGWSEDKGGPIRSLDRFEADPGVSEGFWIEALASYAQDVVKDDVGSRTSTSVDTGAVRLSYGMDMFEAGLTFPFWRHLEVERRAGTVRTAGGEGLGDLRAFVKAVPLRTDYFDAGAGLSVGFPTGSIDGGLTTEETLLVPGNAKLQSLLPMNSLQPGTGKFQFTPYGIVAAHYGPFEVRAHGGYTFVASHTTRSREVTVFGGGIYYRWTDQVGFRSEINGGTVHAVGDNPNVLAWQPGIDIRLPRDGYDIVLRPTGSYGITDETADWGIGGSITVWLRP